MATPLTNTNILGEAASLDAMQEDIRMAKPPVDIPAGWIWFWVAVALVVFAVVAWLLWRYWLKEQFTAKPPIIRTVPAHITARKRLQAAHRLLDRPYPFSFAVSDALRHYLEDRFLLHAPERTTEEFLPEVETSKALPEELRPLLAEFLFRCDLVKFAREEPSREELEQLHRVAFRIVDETTPGMRPLEQPVGKPIAA